MKKILLFITIITLLSGCQQNEYELIFDKNSAINCFSFVYEFEDGTKVYTDYTNIRYKKNDVEMSIVEALEKKLMNLEDIKKYEEFKVFKEDDQKPLGCIN